MAIVADLSGNYPANVGGPDLPTAYGHIAASFAGISATTAPFYWRGGDGTFKVEASFGGGTVSLEMLLPDNVTWAAVGTNTTLTANGAGNFTLDPGWLRVAVTTATSVDVEVSSQNEFCN